MERRINEEIKQVIANGNLRVLRDAKTNQALGVSYTEDGLKTIANKTGRYLYFKNVTKATQIAHGKKSNRVYSEKFIPRNFEDNTLMKAETHWVKAALHKLYPTFIEDKREMKG